MRTHFELNRAFGQMLTFAPSHVLILLLLSLPGRLVALDLELMLRGTWPSFPRSPANAVALQNGHAFVAADSDGLVILDLYRPSLRLEFVSPQQPGEFRFLVRGDAGLSVRVQRSANLRDWEDWQALTLGATPSELSDLDAGAVPHGSYRAVRP